MATRAREIPALLFALVWLLGYEVVPFAHVALHAQLAPHSHSADGHGASHCHGDVCHGDDEDDAASSDPLSHGENSLEHRGVAALGTDLSVFVPELVLVAEIAEVTAPVAPISIYEATSPPARGPPV